MRKIIPKTLGILFRKLWENCSENFGKIIPKTFERLSHLTAGGNIYFKWEALRKLSAGLKEAFEPSLPPMPNGKSKT